MESAGKGNPLAMIYPPDGSVLIIAPSGIPKNVKHPNAAKLFLDWYLAQEQQGRLGTYSARTDVAPPEGLAPLSAYKIEAGYLQFVSDEARLAELRKRFESYTGPVVNAGGVR